MKSKALAKTSLVLGAFGKRLLNKQNGHNNLLNPSFAGSILIVCDSHLGDCICSLPFISTVRYMFPVANLFFMAPAPLVPIFAQNKLNIKVLEIPGEDVGKNISLCTESKGYDIAFCPWRARDGLLAKAAGARQVYGWSDYKQTSYRRFVDIFIPHPEYKGLSSFVESIKNKTDAESQKFLNDRATCQDYPHLNYEQRFEDFLNIFNPKRPMKIDSESWFSPESSVRNKNVFLHVGSKNPSRHWPAKKFGEFARYVRDIGFNPVWSGTIKDYEYIEEADPEREFESTVGKLSLAELADQLGCASLLVSVDTGIAHLGKLAAVPTIMLRAGGDVDRLRPLKFFKDSDEYIVLPIKPVHYTGIDAIQPQDTKYVCPVGRTHCSFETKDCLKITDGYSACMSAISVDEVKAALNALLANSIPGKN